MDRERREDYQSRKTITVYLLLRLLPKYGQLPFLLQALVMSSWPTITVWSGQALVHEQGPDITAASFALICTVNYRIPEAFESRRAGSMDLT